MKLNPLIAGRKQYVLPKAKSFRWKLDVIENQYPHHPDVIQAAKDAMCDLNLYPYSSPVQDKLMGQIAKYVNCNPEQIILTNGSDSALNLICDCYVSPGVNIVIPQPTYPHMLQFVETRTRDINYVDIKLNDSTDVITEKISSSITENTNLCYLVSPNLPLGYVFCVEQIKSLLEQSPQTMFVVDLAYVEFGGCDYSELLTYKNLILVRTFSKMFGLAAIRLGYLYSHPQNIKYMSAIVNEKSVTMCAIATASAALGNLEYYNSVVEQIELSKVQIASTLDKICSVDSMIYGYNISGANFYLLLAKDTASVCKIFAEHGIYIRDKHGDVPNSIRVAVGRPEQNRDVLDIVKLINLNHILCTSKVVYDLDNTLRIGSKNTTVPYAGSKLLEHYNSFICTNNTSYTPDEISQYFAANGIKISSDRIYSPLTYAKQILSGVYTVLGSQNVIDYFGNSHPLTEGTDVVYLANKHFLDETTIIKLCKYKKQLYYTIGGDKIDLDNYADTDESGDILIPDIGAIGHLMSKFMQTMPIGKPNPDILPLSENLVIVGDSDSDKGLAIAKNALFIKVDPTADKIQCGFDNTIIVPSVDELYQYLN
ncbi:Histidinol-phosphate aminotransferase [Pacmanvirus A23]|uniref:Histidinol-phosphate aminotransferase n=1 Tax=Pacmanvirus A23 TaxID=1932881 RepID=UPI000A09251A|nr:Histidinol-phosphate aminotransferase [Pacmanvirus A23]SIP86164.1 Histidinol-phosphate aminotransferase [Pacmanvirus A23]